jgi:hypothetical protein
MNLRIGISTLCYTILAFFLNLPGISAQTVYKGTYSIGVHGLYGFVLKHAPSVRHLAKAHPYGVEINYNQLTNGSKEWHKVYRYPEAGFALGVFNFRNPVLGQAIYGIAHLDKALLQGKTSALRLKIGTGATFITNPYDADKNFQNTALSSRLMYALRGELLYSYQPDKHWQLRSGITITHFSNGAFKVPNSGINIPAIKLGILYNPQVPVVEVAQPDSSGKAMYSSVEFNVSGAFTIKEIDLPGGAKYPGGVLSAYVNRRLNRKSAINIGMDGFYNTALKQIIESDPDIDTLQIPDFKRVGITLGHELFISRISMLVQLGIYVYKPYQQVDTRVYQRYGLKYAINRYLFAGVFLKSHYGTADFVEWTLGVKW